MCPPPLSPQHGYDPRCRGWYADGYESRDETPTFVSAPYVFASTGITGCSMTTSIIDPSTDEHVGQVLLDFIPQPIIDASMTENTAVGSGKEGFTFIITKKEDHLGNNVIAAPGFDLSMAGTHIMPLIVGKRSMADPFVADVLEKMEAGEMNTATYDHIDYGESFVAFAPVKASTLTAVDHRDFSAGVSTTEQIVYSFGVSISQADLVLPFTMIEDKIESNIAGSIVILVILIIVCCLLVGLLASAVAMSITNPVITLLNIVQHINNKDLKDDLPHMSGGSKEVSS